MYSDKSDKELLELLQKYKTLTFQSQLYLQKELNGRNINENTKDLNTTIEKKNIGIKEFEYLKDIGFLAENFGDSIRITRTTKAIIIDLIAVFLGVIFIIVGLFGLITLLGSFVNETGFSIISLLKVGLGIMGIKFLNGIKRLLDFLGFELVNTGRGTVTLKKRFDMKLIEIEKDVSYLNLEKQSDRLILKLDDNEVLSANAKNIVQRKTINELTNMLKTVTR